MLIHYLKFSLFHLLTLTTILAILMGQHWIPIGYAAITVFIVFGDALLGDDNSTPEFDHPKMLTLQLYLALPLLCVLVFVSLWSVSEYDIFGFGHFISQLTNYNFLEAKQQTSTWQHVCAVFFVGLMVSTTGTVTGHELVHRTWNNLSICIGRWLLAFSFDANFSIEHVYGHHKHVATPEDPATAPRGRNVYSHIILSTIKGNISAWKIEKSRLERKQQPVLSLKNVCIRGYLMSVLLLLMAFIFAGSNGLAFLVCCGIWAKVMLEITNYMEHYGLVRVVNKRVEPRHSWNTNRKISSWAMFNLSRHSHHHAHGQLPFHKLKPYPNAPHMFSGYLATLVITLFPPIWFKLMAPKLADWDENYASSEEKTLLKK